MEPGLVGEGWAAAEGNPGYLKREGLGGAEAKTRVRAAGGGCLDVKGKSHGGRSVAE